MEPKSKRTLQFYDCNPKTTKVLIFNQFIFGMYNKKKEFVEHEKSRLKGTESDVNHLKEIFRCLKYDEINHFDNKTSVQIKEIIKNSK